MAEAFNSNSTNKEGLSNIVNKIFYFVYYSIIIIFFIFVFSVGVMFLVDSLEELDMLGLSFLIFVLPGLLTFSASLIASITVYRDAKKLKNQGANVESPFFWAIITFISVGLPLYLAFRKVDYKKQIKNKINSGQAPIINPQGM